jgi:hypothetical protein
LTLFVIPVAYTLLTRDRAAVADPVPPQVEPAPN